MPLQYAPSSTQVAGRELKCLASGASAPGAGQPGADGVPAAGERDWLRELEVCKFCVPAQSSLCITPSHRVQPSDYMVGPTIPEPPPAENKGILTLQV